MSKEVVILAFNTAGLDREIATTPLRIAPNADICARLAAAEAFWALRPSLEMDFASRHPIPYIVVKRGDKFLRYTRGSGGNEARLHAKRSIGFGGHVDHPENIVPPAGPIDILAAINHTAEQELHEEIGAKMAAPQWVATIASDANEVDRVHLGIVGVVEAPAEMSFEDVIEGVEEVTAAELAADDRLESWSRLIADNLDAILKAAAA